MNDKQQIEFEKGWEEYQDKKKKDIEELAKAMKQAYYCKDFDQLASVLIKQGYYKTPEDSVVLTKTNYEKLCHLAYFGYDDVKAQARKETAREFVKNIKQKYGKSCSEYYPFLLIECLSSELDELAKEYGVEIKE